MLAVVGEARPQDQLLECSSFAIEAAEARRVLLAFRAGTVRDRMSRVRGQQGGERVGVAEAVNCGVGSCRANGWLV